MHQHFGNCIPHDLKDPFSVLKTQLHFGGMNVHIQKLWFNLQLQHGKRVLMLHHKRLVSLLDRLINDAAFHIPSINKINFKIAVIAGNHRLACESFHRNVILFFMNG